MRRHFGVGLLCAVTACGGGGSETSHRTGDASKGTPDAKGERDGGHTDAGPSDATLVTDGSRADGGSSDASGSDAATDAPGGDALDAGPCSVAIGLAPAGFSASCAAAVASNDAIFVDGANGVDAQNGTADHPVQTLTAALALYTASTGRRYVFLANYTESKYDGTQLGALLSAGCIVAGSLDPAKGWARANVSGTTGINSTIAGPVSGVRVRGGVGGLWYVTVEGADAPTTADAGASTDAYGLILYDSPGFVLHAVQLVSGNAAEGSKGVPGQSWSDAGSSFLTPDGGEEPLPQAGKHGQNAGAVTAANADVPYLGDGGLGANAGSNPTPPDGIGGNGMICAGTEVYVIYRKPTAGTDPSGGVGDAGAGMLEDPSLCVGPDGGYQTCDPSAAEYPFCADSLVPLGSPGGAGANGLEGDAGGAEHWAAPYDGGLPEGPFAWDGGFLHSAPPRAGRGGYGGPGGGGGGCCLFDVDEVPYHGVTSNSGGGGSGGQGGSGGYAGTPGGSSIALVVVSSGSGSAFPTSVDVTLVSGRGGNGGQGGSGGTGAPGGIGGLVGDAAATTPGTTWQAGGSGGTGGQGGGGAGGIGGNTLGFLYVGAGGPASLLPEAGILRTTTASEGVGGPNGLPNGIIGQAGISRSYLWLH